MQNPFTPATAKNASHNAQNPFTSAFAGKPTATPAFGGTTTANSASNPFLSNSTATSAFGSSNPGTTQAGNSNPFSSAGSASVGFGASATKNTGFGATNLVSGASNSGLGASNPGFGASSTPATATSKPANPFSAFNSNPEKPKTNEFGFGATSDTSSPFTNKPDTSNQTFGQSVSSSKSSANPFSTALPVPTNQLPESSSINPFEKQTISEKPKIAETATFNFGQTSNPKNSQISSGFSFGQTSTTSSFASEITEKFGAEKPAFSKPAGNAPNPFAPKTNSLHTNSIKTSNSTAKPFPVSETREPGGFKISNNRPVNTENIFDKKPSGTNPSAVNPFMKKVTRPQSPAPRSQAPVPRPQTPEINGSSPYSRPVIAQITGDNEEHDGLDFGPDEPPAPVPIVGDARDILRRKRLERESRGEIPDDSRKSSEESNSRENRPDRVNIQVKKGTPDARAIIKLKKDGKIKTPEASSDSSSSSESGEISDDDDQVKVVRTIENGDDSDSSDIGGPVVTFRKNQRNSDDMPPTPPGGSNKIPELTIDIKPDFNTELVYHRGSLIQKSDLNIHSNSPFSSKPSIHTSGITKSNPFSKPRDHKTAKNVLSESLRQARENKRTSSSALSGSPANQQTSIFAAPSSIPRVPRVNLPPAPTFPQHQQVPLMSPVSISRRAADIVKGFDPYQCHERLTQRDKALRNQELAKPEYLRDGSSGIEGKCPDMCPEGERYFRIFSDQVSVFEKSNQEPDHNKMIKEFERGAADADITLPHQVRPLPILIHTVNYICKTLMSDYAPTPNYETFDVDSRQRQTEIGDWYGFIWNRFRAIRKDITQMRMQSRSEAINIMQICTRFHIYCQYAFCQEAPHVFDTTLNKKDHIDKCITTLKQTGKGFTAEFIAIEMCLNFRNPQEIAYALTFADGKMLKNRYIRRARKAFMAYETRQTEVFFKILETSEPIFACILHDYRAFGLIWRPRVEFKQRKFCTFSQIFSMFSHLFRFVTFSSNVFHADEMRAFAFDNLVRSTKPKSDVPLEKFEKEMRLYDERLDEYVLDCGLKPEDDEKYQRFVDLGDKRSYISPINRKVLKKSREKFIDDYEDQHMNWLVGVKDRTISSIVNPDLDLENFVERDATTVFGKNGQIGDTYKVPDERITPQNSREYASRSSESYDPGVVVSECFSRAEQITQIPSGTVQNPVPTPFRDTISPSIPISIPVSTPAINPQALINQAVPDLVSKIITPVNTQLTQIIATARLKVAKRQQLIKQNTNSIIDDLITKISTEIAVEEAAKSFSKKLKNLRTDNIRITAERAEKRVFTAVIEHEARKIASARLKLAREKHLAKTAWNFTKEIMDSESKKVCREVADDCLKTATYEKTHRLDVCKKKIQKLRMVKVFEVWQSRIAIRKRRFNGLLTTPPKRSKHLRMGVVGKNLVDRRSFDGDKCLKFSQSFIGENPKDVANRIDRKRKILENPESLQLKAKKSLVPSENHAVFDGESSFFKNIWPNLRQVRKNSDKVKHYSVFCDFKGELALPLTMLNSFKPHSGFEFSQILPDQFSDDLFSSTNSNDVNMVCLSREENFHDVVNLLQSKSFDLSSIPILVKTDRKCSSFSLKYHVRCSDLSSSENFTQTDIEWALRISGPRKADFLKLTVAEILNHVISSRYTLNVQSVMTALSDHTDSKLVSGLARYPFDSLLDDENNWKTEQGFKNYLSRLHILDSRAKLRFSRMLKKIKEKLSKPIDFGINSLFGENQMDTSNDFSQVSQRISKISEQIIENHELRASFSDFKPLFRLILEFKLNPIMDNSVRVRRDFFQNLRKRKISVSGGSRSRGSSFSKAQKRMSSPVRQISVSKDNNSDSESDGEDLIQMAKRRLAEMSDKNRKLKEKAGNFDRVLKEQMSSNGLDRDLLDNLLPDIKTLFEQNNTLTNIET